MTGSTWVVLKSPLSSITEPVKMSETKFESLEKMGKKQNKEQVPPPAETQQKKLNAAKQSKKSQSSSSSKPTHYKTLEDAIKAVSAVHVTMHIVLCTVCVCIYTHCVSSSLCGRLYFSPFLFQLDLVELRQQLEKSQAMFPQNPCVWVKDLAGYLNSKLLAPDADPTLSSYPHGACLNH